MNPKDKTTHFGYQEIPLQDKVEKVSEVFSSVASRYDLMNDLMSFGLHRYWKRYTIAKSNIHQGSKVLDIAGGTGDLAALHYDNGGEVMLADINEAMLRVGRDRFINRGVFKKISYVVADGETLPLPKNNFDCVTIAFGLRNITTKENALREMFRVLKPGGKCLILEFSKPVLPLLNKLYDSYSFNVIPKLGEWICKDRDSYQYLVESIRMHPDQETLKTMMQSAGFEDVAYDNLTGGVVALHYGYKY